MMLDRSREMDLMDRIAELQAAAEDFVVNSEYMVARIEAFALSEFAREMAMIEEK
jgi:hypothetical protein